MDDGFPTAPVEEPVEAGSAASDEPSLSRDGLRVLLAERRASTHSELSRRLARLGHQVLARVTTGQAALDYAGLLRPDVVLVAPVLEDTAGVLTALTVTRELPGIAAVVLTCHPAAADPSARPNWGAVALVPADAELDDLDAELRAAVRRALEIASLAGATEIDSAPEPLVEAHVAAIDPLAINPPEKVEAEAIEAEPADTESPQEPVALAATEPEAAETPKPEPEIVTSLAETSKPELEIVPSLADTKVDSSATSEPDEDLELPLATFAYAQDDAPAAGPSAERDVVRAAAEALVARSGFSLADALQMMEEEAVDLNESLESVARAVLGEPRLEAVSGEVSAIG